jgi:hypothetical protein
MLIRQWPHGKKSEVHWGSELLQILQEVRGNCKTRNQLIFKRWYPDMDIEVEEIPAAA